MIHHAASDTQSPRERRGYQSTEGERTTMDTDISAKHQGSKTATVDGNGEVSYEVV